MKDRRVFFLNRLNDALLNSVFSYCESLFFNYFLPSVDSGERGGKICNKGLWVGLESRLLPSGHEAYGRLLDH